MKSEAEWQLSLVAVVLSRCRAAVRLTVVTGIYNAKRMHSALGYQSRTEFETQLAQQAAWF